MKQTLEVLLSCMNQTDHAILDTSNLRGVRTLVINQCGSPEETLEQVDDLHRYLHTGTRGLSVSRNLALDLAEGDICLISDDDEFFLDGLEEKILQAYADLPDADIIVFWLTNRKKRHLLEVRRLTRYELLRVASWQISFRRRSVLDSGVRFDIRMGAGTGNGGGEENKFLFDCYDRGLKIYSVPVEIATGLEENSTWFFGYDEKFFYNRGMSTRHILGFPMSSFYAIYYLVRMYPEYKKDTSVLKATKSIFKGIVENKLKK